MVIPASKAGEFTYVRFRQHPLCELAASAPLQVERELADQQLGHPPPPFAFQVAERGEVPREDS